MKGIECIELRKFITEYKQKNEKNEFKPVAVGKYGIRTRESIYSKELAKDYSKNKIIFKNTLTVGMGSRQIDIGILTDDVIYSVSPAYHTYKISDINADYLRYCLMCRNEDMFKRFVKRGSRQGKSIDLKRWLEYEIPVYDVCNQEKIVLKLNKVTNVISMRKQQLQKLDELIQARFVEMFGDPISNSLESNMLPMTDVCEIIDGDRGKNYPTQEEFNEKGYCLFLNAKNVTNVGFNFDKCMFITKQKDEILRKGKLCRGDVVLTTRGTIGNMAYYTEKIPFEHIRINSGMVILRMKHEIINEVFFIEQFKMQIANIKSKIASGSAQPQLPISTMNRIHILIPDINSQNQFADFVNQVNKSKLVIKNLLQIYKHQIQM